MTPHEAAVLLDLPADTSPEQLEARFLELRTKLEDKIAKAPTPGLKAKYRESLEKITQAFETLTLAADSTSLPVVHKTQTPSSASQAAISDNSGLRSQISGLSTGGLPPAKRAKSGSKEFAIVAIIAVLLLAAGGWFVMKTRAENAEKARIAAEVQAEKDRQAAAAKAEQERVAEVARLAAEEKKRAEEAERTRLEKLAGQLRGELAEAKVIWEAIEREEHSAERRLSELKSDLRSLRDVSTGALAQARAEVAAQQEYYDWLSDTLARHPAKLARSRTDELLSAKQPDAAQAALTELKTALAALDREIPAQRAAFLDLEGELKLETDADAAWTLQDAFGRTRSGKGPAQLDGLAIGPGRLELQKPRWPSREEKFTIRSDRPVELIAAYVAHDLRIESSPADAEVRQADGTRLGVTPLQLTGLPPGPLAFTLSKAGYYDEPVNLTLPQADTEALSVSLRAKPTGLVKPDRWAGPAKVRVETNIQISGSAPSQTHFIEEWEFSEPDPQVGWRQAIKRFVSLAGSNRQYMPVDGSTLRLRRQPNGTWNGEFIKGGLPDPAHNVFWTSAANSFWLVNFGLTDLLPATEVEIGGTWTVKPEVFFPTIGIPNATGKATGRVLAIERDSPVEWADLEYSYDYTIGGIDSQNVLKLRVNLTEGYVARMETHGSASDIRTSSSTTVTKQ